MNIQERLDLLTINRTAVKKGGVNVLEAVNRKLVKTNKEHECYGCCEPINKGLEAVYVKGKEDNLHKSFHLHIECNKIVNKHKMFAGGFEKGSTKEGAVALFDGSFDFNDTSYPF